MIKIGIIGTDAVAHIHTGGLLTDNNYEIAGCYALDNRDSMVFARQYRLVSYSSIEALFKFTDAIDITDDFPDVMTLAEKSLKAMKHVYIAQSHRLSLKDVKYLMELANESSVVLQLGYGYRHCPAYESLIELKQAPRLINIRHQLLNTGGRQLYAELIRDIDFVHGVLHANIHTIHIKTWTKSESYTDLINCRMECDNGCSINLVMHVVPEGDSKLEVVLDLPNTVIHVDVFKSVMEKRYCEFDVTDSIVLDAYNEKAIHRQYLKNFQKAIRNDLEAIRRIDDQVQSIAAADYIVERARQLRVVTA